MPAMGVIKLFILFYVEKVFNAINFVELFFSGTVA